MGYISKQWILHRDLLGHRQSTSSHSLSTNSISTKAKMCRSYSRKYKHYELMLTQGMLYSEDYNSWVSLLFPWFSFLTTHSDVMSVSSEWREVDLDDTVELSYSIYYEYQHSSKIITMYNQILCIAIEPYDLLNMLKLPYRNMFLIHS